MGLNTQRQLPDRSRFLSTRFFVLFMFLFMLGLLVITAILAYSTVTDVKEMLVPEPVRVK